MTSQDDSITGKCAYCDFGACGRCDVNSRYSMGPRILP
jgi:hypothetical protein